MPYTLTTIEQDNMTKIYLLLCAVFVAFLSLMMCACNKQKCYTCTTDINGDKYNSMQCNIDKEKYEQDKTDMWYDGKEKYIMKTECK